MTFAPWMSAAPNILLPGAGDLDEETRRRLLARGILGAGIGLMQAGGPSRTPISLGQGVGQALAGGLEQMDAATQFALQQRAQQAEARRVAELQKARIEDMKASQRMARERLGLSEREMEAMQDYRNRRLGLESRGMDLRERGMEMDYSMAQDRLAQQEALAQMQAELDRSLQAERIGAQQQQWEAELGAKEARRRAEEQARQQEAALRREAAQAMMGPRTPQAMGQNMAYYGAMLGEPSLINQGAGLLAGGEEGGINREEIARRFRPGMSREELGQTMLEVGVLTGRPSLTKTGAVALHPDLAYTDPFERAMAERMGMLSGGQGAKETGAVASPGETQYTTKPPQEDLDLLKRNAGDERLEQRFRNKYGALPPEYEQWKKEKEDTDGSWWQFWK